MKPLLIDILPRRVGLTIIGDWGEEVFVDCLATPIHREANTIVGFAGRRGILVVPLMVLEGCPVEMLVQLAFCVHSEDCFTFPFSCPFAS